MMLPKGYVQIAHYEFKDKGTKVDVTLETKKLFTCDMCKCRDKNGYCDKLQMEVDDDFYCKFGVDLGDLENGGE